MKKSMFYSPKKYLVSDLYKMYIDRKLVLEDYTWSQLMESLAQEELRVYMNNAHKLHTFDTNCELCMEANYNGK